MKRFLISLVLFSLTLLFFSACEEITIPGQDPTACNNSCMAPKAVCSTATNSCVECLANENCSTTSPVCDTVNNKCVVCTSDSNCSGQTPACDLLSNTCKSCVTNDHCNKGYYCSSSNACTLEAQNCKLNSLSSSNTSSPLTPSFDPNIFSYSIKILPSGYSPQAYVNFTKPVASILDFSDTLKPMIFDIQGNQEGATTGSFRLTTNNEFPLNGYIYVKNIGDNGEILCQENYYINAYNTVETLNLNRVGNYIKFNRVFDYETKRLYEYNIDPITDDSLMGKNIDDIKYCLNISSSDTPIDIFNSDLYNKEEDFNCQGQWKSFYELPRTFELNKNKEAILNILLKYDGNYYMYGRTYLRTNTELFSSSSCSEFINKLGDNKSIMLFNSMFCEGVPITSKIKSFTNLYLNGNGHMLDKVSISSNTSGEKLGLVGTLYNSYVSNLFFNSTNINLPNSSKVGTLAGYLNTSIIENVKVFGTVKAAGYVGMLAGEIYETKVNNSKASVCAVEGHNTVGGLIGTAINNSKIDSSIGICSVTGKSSTGGLVGDLNNGSSISNSIASNSVAVTGTHGYLGGLVGYTSINSSITNSRSNNALSCSDCQAVGGLVGYISDNSNITDSSSSSNISLSGTLLTDWSGFGGLVGVSDKSNIYSSYSTGTINGHMYLGGLGGYLYKSKVYKSYTKSKLTGTSHIAGFVAKITSSEIFDSYATGELITPEGLYVGGFAGESLNPIINSSYTTSILLKPELNTGFFLYCNGTCDVSNSYSINQDLNPIVVKLSQEQFADAANFTGFDFTNVWKMSTNAQSPDFNRPHLKYENLE